MIALRILGLVQGGFTPTWSGVPKGFPAREVLAYFCAVVSLLTGMGLLWRGSAVVASRVLLSWLPLWLLLFRLDPPAVVTWWACADTAVMAAGAWLVANSYRGMPWRAAGKR